jgi:hypothetical protein
MYEGLRLKAVTPNFARPAGSVWPFVLLPGSYFASLVAATIAYLVLVELGKRFLLVRTAVEEH